MAEVESLLGSVKPFLEKVFDALEEDGVDVSDFELDHICYRVETWEKYVYFRTKLSDFGIMISEARINGRSIANFKLKEPIIFRDRKIRIVELPAPKKERFFPEGYEHVEFAVRMDPVEFAGQYSELDFNTDDASREINPTVSLSYSGFSVRFHEYSLEYVIENFE